VSNESITQLMGTSAVLVYSASSVGVQALALGLPAVHLRTQFEFNMDPLEGIPEARLEATGLEDLREKVRWLLEHGEEYIAQHRDQWNWLVEDIYGPVTEETIRAFVE